MARRKRSSSVRVPSAVHATTPAGSRALQEGCSSECDSRGDQQTPREPRSTGSSRGGDPWGPSKRPASFTAASPNLTANLSWGVDMVAEQHYRGQREGGDDCMAWCDKPPIAASASDNRHACSLSPPPSAVKCQGPWKHALHSGEAVPHAGLRPPAPALSAVRCVSDTVDTNDAPDAALLMALWGDEDVVSPRVLLGMDFPGSPGMFSDLLSSPRLPPHSTHHSPTQPPEPSTYHTPPQLLPHAAYHSPPQLLTPAACRSPSPLPQQDAASVVHWSPSPAHPPPSVHPSPASFQSTSHGVEHSLAVELQWAGNNGLPVQAVGAYIPPSPQLPVQENVLAAPTTAQSSLHANGQWHTASPLQHNMAAQWQQSPPHHEQWEQYPSYVLLPLPPHAGDSWQIEAAHPAPLHAASLQPHAHVVWQAAPAQVADAAPDFSDGHSMSVPSPQHSMPLPIQHRVPHTVARHQLLPHGHSSLPARIAPGQPQEPPAHQLCRSRYQQDPALAMQHQPYLQHIAQPAHAHAHAHAHAQPGGMTALLQGEERWEAAHNQATAPSAANAPVETLDWPPQHSQGAMCDARAYITVGVAQMHERQAFEQQWLHDQQQQQQQQQQEELEQRQEQEQQLHIHYPREAPPVWTGAEEPSSYHHVQGNTFATAPGIYQEVLQSSVCVQPQLSSWPPPQHWPEQEVHDGVVSHFTSPPTSPAIHQHHSALGVYSHTTASASYSGVAGGPDFGQAHIQPYDTAGGELAWDEQPNSPRQRSLPSGGVGRGDGGEGSFNAGGKRQRDNLPKSSVRLMREWLYAHIAHPYPSETEKARMMLTTNLTLNQVNNWFINARVRMVRPIVAAVWQEHQTRLAAAARAQGDEAILAKLSEARTSQPAQVSLIVADEVALAALEAGAVAAALAANAPKLKREEQLK